MNALEYKNWLQNLESEQGEKSLLLHSCCAPCSSAVIERLAGHYKLSVFFSNPNIYPVDEFRRRADEEIRLLRALGVPYIEDDCGEDEFLRRVAGLEDCREGGARCAVCFDLRLGRTAERAAALGSDLFATTLTLSPHKNADAVNAAGIRAGERYGIAYLASDFKKQNGYLRSLELSAQYGLYRQDYCGCRFSKAHDT